jgi:hypothetical protein
MCASLEFTQSQYSATSRHREAGVARHSWTKPWPQRIELRDLPRARPLVERTTSLKSPHQELMGLPDFTRATPGATLQYLPKTFNQNSVVKGVPVQPCKETHHGGLGLVTPDAAVEVFPLTSPKLTP